MGAVLALFVLVALAASGSAQSAFPTRIAPTAMVEVVQTVRPSPTPGNRPSEPPGSPDQLRIKELDLQIRTLRDQYKAQADPLQAQVKLLRETLDADLKPLEDERHELVLRGESPSLRELEVDETGQLAALADREKADVEKVHQQYAAERATLKASFDAKRRELHGGRR
jgi:Skp family chaperone for outer membrane proteins